MTVINTNVGALMARTYATRANARMTTSMERLSSGLRINSAADDAAGLAVANKMESQTRGINMAMRNSQDGISLVQTAESGMSEITNMILRMRELAVQMDNGIYTNVDRDNAQLEINALLAEIDKIAANTRFNDVALLNGSYDQTIRAGNTNAETIRVSIDGLYAASTGKQSGGTSLEVDYSLLYGTKTYNSDLADILGLQLNISSSAADVLAASDSQAILSDIVTEMDYQSHGGNVLLLKDDLGGLGYTYAAVKVSDEQLEGLSTNLLQTRGLVEELEGLDPSDTLRRSQIEKSLEQLEVERSHYVGSLYHSNDVKLLNKFVDGGITNGNYAEILNVYSDPITRDTIVDEIVAVEVNFMEMAKTLHSPLTCEHCAALASGGGGDGDAGPGSGGNDFDAYATTHTGTGSSATTVSSPSSDAVSPLIKGSKWLNLGDDSDYVASTDTGNSELALSYSYWDGTSPYSEDEGGPRSAVHANNQTALNTVFGLWDAATPFAFYEVSEDGDGDPVGDLRVAYVTSTDPGGRAAYAYYPSANPIGGDIYFETSAVENDGTNDFVAGNYNWLTALHEIGHAIGLSHPFDGGSKDSSKLNLNLDSQRNTVMTYVQTDRNVYFDQGSTTAKYTYAETPMLLDIEAIEHLYGADDDVDGSNNWEYNDGNDDSYTYNDAGAITIQTIVDSGGTGDTLDASAVTRGSTINLTPGTFSSLGLYETDAEYITYIANGNAALETTLTSYVAQLDAFATAANQPHYPEYTRTALHRNQDNVAIAHNTWLENAIGGAGADTITGNSKANEITGNAGDDTIDGGAGDDVAIYSGNFGTYTVTQSGSTVTVAGGADATDTLTNVEFLKFADGVWSIADAIAGAAATHASIADAALADGADVVVTGGATYGEGGENVSLAGMTLADIGVLTQNHSKSAITILDSSLSEISSARSKLGAIMNRLQHNIDNQSKGGMMSQQARGRIVDTDMAIESTKLAQEMILSQAAQQAINMATQRQATVLYLLEA